MYGVIWDKKASDFLEKNEVLISRRLVKYVKEFSENISSKEFKRLKGRDEFRLRVGDYRVIFKFDHESKKIWILKIGHRKNIYEN